jgi:MFS transporter, DHA2 family, glioxin efflux transporter
MDLLGTFTIMAAVVCYLLALQWGGVTKKWSDSTVIGTLIGFCVLAIAFVINEYIMSDRALLQGRLLKQRVIGVAAAYMGLFAGPFFTLLYYLPIYFQSIKGVSAAQSGIRNLPVVMGASLFSIVSGGLITVYGHYTPLMVLSSILVTIDAGFLYTLEIPSSAREWIGYQALAGIGIGLGFQIPVIVGQASVSPSDISSVSAVMLFFQTIGGSFLVSAAQSAFANRLVSFVPRYAPGVDPHLVVATGASQLRDVFDPKVLPGILEAYMHGIKLVFALCVAMAGITLPIALFSPWKRLHGGGGAAGTTGG